MTNSSRPLVRRTPLSAGAAGALVALLVAMVFALPALAAEEGGHHAQSIGHLIWHSINLIALLIVVYLAARKPINTYFDERRTAIRNDIKKADQLLAESRREFADWQGKLAELEREAETIREETRQRAHDEREQIIAAAHDSAERIKSDAVAAIDQELRRAHAELREEAATLAVDIARGMLEEQIDERDRDRLVDEFITSIEPGGSSAGQGR